MASHDDQSAERPAEWLQGETAINPSDQASQAPDLPQDQTVLYAMPDPRYDEELGDQNFDPSEIDYGRLEHAWQDASEFEPEQSSFAAEGARRKRSRWRPLLALVLVGALASGILAAAAYGLELWGGKSVPNVVGISAVRAQSMLEDAGFDVVEKARTADDGIGFVLEQDPANGERIPEGSTVTIVVAAGRTMPELVGLSLEEAEALLAKVGAEDVHVVLRTSTEAEGTVLAVDPEVGETFSAHQTVTLYVAQKSQVPDVHGMDRVAATAAIEEAGFAIDVVFVVSDEAPNTAVTSDPEPGTKLEPGSAVKVYFSEPMPSDPLHLIEYVGKRSTSVGAYLPKKGFYLSSSHVSSNGYAEAAYYSEDYGTLIFCERPFSHAFDWDANTGEDVLGNGYEFAGIRWEVPSWMLPSGASELGEAATHDLMTRCGLSNVTDVCTNVDVQVPEGTKKGSTKFRCTYGESGGCSWSILLVNEEDGTRAVVTCARTSYYKEHYDLKPYGNSICDMIAYADVYTEW